MVIVSQVGSSSTVTANLTRVKVGHLDYVSCVKH